MKYRKRPIVVEAVQWLPAEIQDWDQLPDGVTYDENEEAWYCETLEGQYLLKGGEWIVTGLKGEHYPVQEEIFQLSFFPLAEAEDTERVREEIIFAHDLMKTLLAGGVPGKNPNMQQAEVWQASLNALCWVLGHEFGQVLQDNIEKIHAAIKRGGGSFEPGPGSPPEEGPTAFSLN